MAVTSSRFRQAMREGSRIALLCYIDHPDGDTRYWSGTGPLRWGGHDWVGIGALGKVGGFSKKTTLDIGQFTLELSGIAPQALEFLSSNVRNRSARLWLAAVEKQQVHGTYLLADSLMDNQKITVGSDKRATIVITVNVDVWQTERAINKSWTHEEQQLLYPGDTGMSLIPSLTNKQSNWRLS